MKYKAIQRKGWRIRHNKEFFFSYDPDVLGELGAWYVVDEAVYKRALDDDIDLHTLIEEFDIFSKYEKMGDIRKPPKVTLPPNTDTYYDNGSYILTVEDGEYYIKYHASMLGGGYRKFKIWKEVYDDARSNYYKPSELFKKYNLYRFDNPENDVR